MTRYVAPTLLTTLLAFAVHGCGDTIVGPGSVPDARASLEVAGQSTELEASPYRDFMPGPDPDTSLTVALELTAENPGEVAVRVREFGRIWVQHGDEVWSGDVINVPERVSGNTVLVGRADGGPEWPTGDTVTVVVAVETVTRGTVHLKAADVEISRVS